MFCSLRLIIKRLNLHMPKHSFATVTKMNKDKWDLYAGVLVERLPVISREFNTIEKEFRNYLMQVEFEKSLKSNSELQHERELKQAELLKKGEVEVDLDEAASKQTVQDLEDFYTDELNKFSFAARLTNDDKTNNIASTNRCLDSILYLLIEQKLGNTNHYLLPQGQRMEGETMRQAAERILKEKCGTKMQVQFYGNIPCGFYKYKYPKSMRLQSVGVKIFFYRSVLKYGNVEKTTTKNYEWLRKESLIERFDNLSYSESVQKFLL